jgi:hypothetical protein
MTRLRINLLPAAQFAATFLTMIAALLISAPPASASSVSNVTVANASPSAGAGARTQYVVNFTATTGLSGSSARMNVTFPSDTTFTGFVNGVVFDVTSNQTVGSCFSPTGLNAVCFLSSGQVVNAGDTVRITFNGVTNPSTPGPYTVDASTTSDTAPVTSGAGGTSDNPPPEPPLVPPPPPPPPPPTTLADLPDPELAVAVNVQEVSGEVLVGIPAGAAQAGGGGARASQKGVRFVPLSQVRQIPVGSFLDTRRGTARVQSARDSRGTRQNGDFSSGLFQVLQSRKKSAKGLTDLVLKGASFNSCKPKRGKGAQTALSKSALRRLRANARGRFRTRGRYSAATVRGTVWTTTDRCDGTLTKVSRGKVAVRDFRRKKTVLVKAGKSYLAKAPG